MISGQFTRYLYPKYLVISLPPSRPPFWGNWGSKSLNRAKQGQKIGYLLSKCYETFDHTDCSEWLILRKKSGLFIKLPLYLKMKAYCVYFAKLKQWNGLSFLMSTFLFWILRYSKLSFFSDWNQCHWFERFF